jgi:hypothetical protein
MLDMGFEVQQTFAVRHFSKTGSPKVKTMRVLTSLNLGDRVFADFWIREMRTTCIALSDGFTFAECNAVGKIHSPRDFEVGQDVWFSLAGHLYKGQISDINGITFRVKGYGFDEQSNEFTCGTNCDLSQLVKLEDWNTENACPWPRI